MALCKQRENDLAALRLQGAIQQKSGLPFILASVFIWLMLILLYHSNLPIQQKNVYAFFCSTPLLPLAYVIAKCIGVDFKNKENPLSALGILFSMNQMLYILIVMWVCSYAPEKMLMVYAMVFGAHLLPYGWLYASRLYVLFSLFIPCSVLYLGVQYSPQTITIFMFAVELCFSILLRRENRRCLRQ